MPDTLGSLRDFTDVVAAAPLAVVATVDPDGLPEAALVEIAATDAGDLLFTTATATRKVANLRRRARAAVVVGCTGTLSLQVEGAAVVESGASRVEAARVYLAAFPGSRVLDDGFSLVRVRPEWIRQYDTAFAPPAVTEGGPAWAERPMDGRRHGS